MVFETVMSNPWVVWVMEWHWGWQVFWGMMLLGLVGQIVEWFGTGTDSMIMDIKIWCLQFTAWLFELLAKITGIIAAGAMLWVVFSALAEYAAA